MPRPIRTFTLAALLTLVAACTGGGGGASPGATGAGGSAAAGGDCSADALETKNEGRLTIGTSNPAFPPYVLEPEEGETATEPWELGDPTKGRGFEAAVAYAVAEELGFATEEVDWIPVPFENTFAPGEKEFDFALQQVSYTEERAEVVDMSEGYYFVNQALVTRSGTDLEAATSIDEVRAARLGVASGTTSLTYIEEVIQPEQDPMVYNDNDGAIAALDAEQVDGIVVDLPTAFFITAVQMEDGVIVGQFPAAGDEEEYFSLVLEQDSPLTDCVNQALATLRDSGELDAITEEWMSESAGAPVIEP
jgi:polar amino acid transport system substrate-binding protein